MSTSLIANDFLNQTDDTKVDNLTSRRDFVLNWLRNWQFNQYFEDVTLTMIKYYRQWIIFNEFLSKYYDFESDFLGATNGVSLKRFFRNISYIYNAFSLYEPYFAVALKRNMCSTIKANKNEIELITDKWSVTPDDI